MNSFEPFNNKKLTHEFFFLQIGTSIGFKNIASKIAYDLRLWLNRQVIENNINSNNQLIASNKNNQTSPLTEKLSKTSINENEDAVHVEDIWSFDSGDDVIEISLDICTKTTSE